MHKNTLESRNKCFAIYAITLESGNTCFAIIYAFRTYNIEFLMIHKNPKTIENDVCYHEL